MYKLITNIILFLSFPLVLFSQEKLKDGFTKFYYDNGQVSSEGIIKNGKPEGYWKSYYITGLLKSEGYRKNYLLDSTWKFYNKVGDLKSEINYSADKKNGIKITYSDSCNIILEENFVNNIKHGWTTYYYDIKEKKEKLKINLINGIIEGKAFEYELDGRLITIITYKKGNLINKEYINRYDKIGKKKDVWKEFYYNGRLKIESRYKNGLLNGYLKEYDIKGKLVNATLYVNGEIKKHSEELETLEINKEYYQNGKIRKEGTYDITGKEHGTIKYFDKKGKIEKTELFVHGTLLARGLIDENGKKQGYWEYYYKNKQIQSQGNYKDDFKIDNWDYYYEDGKIEQQGKYLKEERLHGLWKWYHPNGELLREENFRKGLEDGMLVEYSDKAVLITKGEFIDGLKDGFWFYELGDHREEGNYQNGKKQGYWKYYYDNEKLSFEGTFIEGIPDGKHKYYFKTGKIREEENYIMGIKSGNWKKFSESGEIIITIDYKDGKEYKIDGNKIK